MESFGGIGAIVVLVIFMIWFWNSVYIIKEWERGVVLRLGRMLPEAKGAGLANEARQMPAAAAVRNQSQGREALNEL